MSEQHYLPRGVWPLAEVCTYLGQLTGYTLSIAKLVESQGGHMVYLIRNPKGEAFVVRRIDQLP